MKSDNKMSTSFESLPGLPVATGHTPMCTSYHFFVPESVRELEALPSLLGCPVIQESAFGTLLQNQWHWEQNLDCDWSC